VTSSEIIGRHAGIDREYNNFVQDGRERAVIGFADLQFFALIYLQKFALFAPSFSLSVPMLIMSASVGWMAVSRNLDFVASRLAIFLVFISCCFFSESLARGSLPSFMQVILLYSSMTVCANLSGASYRRILNRFIMLMVLPAGIVITQYAYQKLTGLSDPFDLERLFPKSILMPGFFYNAHYPRNSAFSRPNGFFFLEPSFASAFTASAAILEISYFRRPWCVALMVGATFLSLAATGISMLIIAAPFLLSRETPRVVALAVGVAVVALIVAYMLDLPIPMVSRVEEMDNAKSSGGTRLGLPLKEFQTLLFDPSFVWTGGGAGSIPPSAGNVWPFVKLLREYGLLAMISFLVLYIVGLASNSNFALKVALSIVYFFTGGYLLSPTLANLVILFCFILIPNNGFTHPRLGFTSSQWAGSTGNQDVALKQRRSQEGLGWRKR
jgi:hypothetical protein